MEKSCVNKVILAYLLNFCIAKTAEKNECKGSKGKKLSTHFLLFMSYF